MLFQNVSEPKPKKKKAERTKDAWSDNLVRPGSDAYRRMSRIENERPPATANELNFRHGHWRNTRARIREQLSAAGTGTKALENWDACGSGCRAEYSKSRDKIRLSANYCKNRHCQPCMRAKANLIARNLRAKLEAGDRRTFRFITLTLKHSRDPLAKQIGRLKACFKKLRKSPCWKKTQDGGVVTIEVKWTGVAWHPHLHIISQGRFLRKETLSENWHEVTGDSYIVDIRQLDDERDAVHYVVKYVTKGVSPAVWEKADLAQEWIISSRGIRCADTFGTWRGFRLLEQTAGIKDWVILDSLEGLIRRARSGEKYAESVLLVLRPPGAADHTAGGAVDLP
jgi:Replication protein